MSIASDIDAAMRLSRDDCDDTGRAAETAFTDPSQGYYRRASELRAVAFSSVLQKAVGVICHIPQEIRRTFRRG